MAKLPIFVSPEVVNGKSLPYEFLDRVNAGWGGGWFQYTPGSLQPIPALTQLAVEYPDGFPILASPKQTDETSTNEYFNVLPQAWRDQVLACYFQEPEDNFTTDPQRALFRASVTKMAGLVRPWGARNGVHLQEWSLNPMWREVGHTYKFVQGIEEDIDFVAWSLLGQPNDTWADWKVKADRLAHFMATYLPNHEWGVTSSAQALSAGVPQGDPLRVARAQLVKDVADYVVGLGSKTWGWFDWNDFDGNGAYARVDTDPLLLDSMLYIASLDVPEAPVVLPPDTSHAQDIILDEGFEGGSSGSIVTVANTDFNETPYQTEPVTFSNSRVKQGGLSAHFHAENEIVLTGFSSAQVPEKYLTFYINPTSRPPGTLILVMVTDEDDVRTFQLSMNSDGTLKIQNKDALLVGGYSTLSPLPLNEWSRVDLSFEGSTATVELYAGDGASGQYRGTAPALDTISGDVGASVNTHWWFGSNNRTNVDFYLDAIRMATDMTPGPMNPLQGDFTYELYWDDGTAWTKAQAPGGGSTPGGGGGTVEPPVVWVSDDPTKSVLSVSQKAGTPYNSTNANLVESRDEDDALRWYLNEEGLPRVQNTRNSKTLYRVRNSGSNVNAMQVTNLSGGNVFFNLDAQGNITTQGTVEATNIGQPLRGVLGEGQEPPPGAPAGIYLREEVEQTGQMILGILEHNETPDPGAPHGIYLRRMS